RALGDTSPDVRHAATSVLVITGSDTVVRLLCDALSSRALRPAAVKVLTQLGMARFIDDLSVLAPSVRRCAVEAIGAIGGPSGAEPLVRALADPEPGVRKRAAELLGEIGDPSVRDELDRACDDPVAEVADAARSALHRLGSTEPAFA